MSDVIDVFVVIDLSHSAAVLSLRGINSFVFARLASHCMKLHEVREVTPSPQNTRSSRCRVGPLAKAFGKAAGYK